MTVQGYCKPADTVVSRTDAINIAEKKGCYKTQNGWRTSVSYNQSRQVWVINARKNKKCYFCGRHSFTGRAKWKYMEIDAVNGEIVVVKKPWFAHRYSKF